MKVYGAQKESSPAGQLRPAVAITAIVITQASNAPMVAGARTTAAFTVSHKKTNNFKENHMNTRTHKFISSLVILLILVAMAPLSAFTQSAGGPMLPMRVETPAVALREDTTRTIQRQP